jgi:predicted XRE-type DNA-binding protein
MPLEIPKENNMGFPNNEKLKDIRKGLSKVDPSLTLPSNATKAQIVKYKLCEKFVKYLIENKMTQAELSRRLDLDSARLNEIVKYKISLFTIDKLLELAERLDPNTRIDVA